MQYDSWGRRVDELRTSEGWRTLKAKMQEEGIVGIGYERRYGAFSRVYAFMKQMLATGDSDVVCTLRCAFAGRLGPNGRGRSSVPWA